MNKTIRTCRILAMATTLALAPAAFAQHSGHDRKMPGMAGPDAAAAAEMKMPPDTRQAVNFPPPLKAHELANMRDHLVTIADIQQLLSRKEFDKAADLAEKRLGMSSFGLHGAHQVAPFMPKGMQDLGNAMHRAASRFAVAAQEAAVDQDVAKAVGALNQVTQACVACHAAYRLN